MWLSDATDPISRPLPPCIPFHGHSLFTGLVVPRQSWRFPVAAWPHRNRKDRETLSVEQHAPTIQGFEPAQMIDFYRQMLTIRRFEQKCAEMYAAGSIGGFLHLYIGEEAVAVGAINALQPEDHIFTHYRDHGYAIARGSDPRVLMAELFGKSTGCSHGKGGSMHLCDPQRNFHGGYAIVAGHLPLAVGNALASQYQGRKEVTLVIFGDGATDMGEFHESLNMASVWRLPVLFLCENNLYAMGTPIKETTAAATIAEKSEGYNMPTKTVDGQDVLAVYQEFKAAYEYVRAGNGPMLIEAETYRYRGHSAVDAQLYRTKEEVLARKSQDPVKTFPAWLREQNVLSQADLDRMEQEAQQTIAAAVTFAEESPEPPIEELYTDVYVDNTGFDFVPSWAK
jgi:pyruvate dehydrogenase E1 component alpha subunit